MLEREREREFVGGRRDRGSESVSVQVLHITVCNMHSVLIEDDVGEHSCTCVLCVVCITVL